MSLLSDYLPTSSAIKSIQRGVLSCAAPQVTTSVAVTSVTMAKSELNFVGQSFNSPFALAANISYIELISATSIRLTRGDGSFGCSVSWELIEWF